MRRKQLHPGMSLYTFFGELRKIVDRDKPKRTCDSNGIVLYDGLTVVPYFMSKVFPNVEYTTALSACKFIQFHGMDIDKLLHCTQSTIEEYTPQNEFY